MTKLALHLAKTPLVNAPARLARALRQHSSYDAISFFEEDYPGALAGMFSSDGIMLKSETPSYRLFRDALDNADIIHIHNMTSPALAEELARLRPQGPYVYQVHSPLREGPLYTDQRNELGVRIERVLVVAQVWPRLYPDAIPVPNIVPDIPFLDRPIRIPRILYTPTHKQAGRWGTKVCNELDKALRSLANRSDVQIVTLPEPMTPAALLDLRRMCDITIDEIVTGGFHQISLEGLVAGNAVINGADEFSLRTMMGWTGSADYPPFIRACPLSIHQILEELIRDPQRIAASKRAARSFAERHLQPGSLVRIFERIYDDVVRPH